MKPNQRNAAQAALPLIAADGRLRVADPTVRKTITVLAELGMLRVRPADRSLKTVPAIGSTRRLQVLSTEGWTQLDLSKALGASVATVKLHRRGSHGRINAELAEAIRDLYESELESPAAELGRTRRTTSWPERWQWRNLNLDDPSVQPHPFLV